MITIYKTTENGLTQISEPTAGSWINVIQPSTEEINWLIEQNIPRDYLTYPLDLDERPRTERENGDTLIIMRIPFFQGAEMDVPYTTLPLGIILNDRYIVTICKVENGIISEFSTGRIRSLETGKRNRFVLRLMLNTAAKYLGYLREINRVVDVLEDQLQLSQKNKEVLELLKYQKSLTYFTTALRANELMLERLNRSQSFRAFPDDEDLLEDVIVENQQAIEMVNISSNILSSMMDAFASIISNNQNAVMKFLASITIIFSVPTMIASFFGMNIPIPMENYPVAFTVIILFSTAISLTIAYIFFRREWF